METLKIPYPYIREFTELLYNVRGILDRILAGFDEFTLLEDDLILIDIFAGLAQIDEANHQLAHYFYDHAAFLTVIQGFSLVVEEAEYLERTWNKSEGKQRLIRDQFYPVFAVWQAEVQEQLTSYTIS